MTRRMTVPDLCGSAADTQQKQPCSSGKRDVAARSALSFAALAVADARLYLNRYADDTDKPAWQAVDASDLLEAVAEGLAAWNVMGGANA